MQITDSHERLLTLAAQIVSSHVGHNDTSADDLPSLIKDVYESLADLSPAEVAPAKAVTHVHTHAHTEMRPNRKVPAVADDHLVCLEDGLTMKMLKRHLITVHGLTPDQYRAKWGLPSNYPMVAANYAKLRSDLAKESGLGLRPEARPKRYR